MMIEILVNPIIEDETWSYDRLKESGTLKILHFIIGFEDHFEE